MSKSASPLDPVRNWFFRNFFRLLVLASSAAMWSVPAWALGAAGGVELSWVSHLVGVLLVFAFNRFVVIGNGRRPGRWLRRYSAVALGALICSMFLGLSGAVFGLGWFAAGVVQPGAAPMVASAFDYWGLFGVTGLSCALLFGYTAGQRQFGVSEITVPVDGWRGRLRILQLSDIHVGQNMAFAHLEEFVAKANSEEPDLICLTGDIADGPQADMERFFPLLGRLRARYGVFAILGNHDHYAGADRVRAALEDNGIRVLCDEATTLDIAGQALHLIGLDDRGLDWARGVQRDETLADLLDRAPVGVPQVLLVHRPDVFVHAAERGVELTLSGHTHGGQLGVPWFGGKPRNLAQVMTSFDRGLFRRGDSWLYVNCGLGVTGQRIRLFTPREISIFELQGAAGEAAHGKQARVARAPLQLVAARRTG